MDSKKALEKTGFHEHRDGHHGELRKIEDGKHKHHEHD